MYLIRLFIILQLKTRNNAPTKDFYFVDNKLYVPYFFEVYLWIISNGSRTECVPARLLYYFINANEKKTGSRNQLKFLNPLAPICMCAPDVLKDTHLSVSRTNVEFRNSISRPILFPFAPIILYFKLFLLSK